MVRSPVVHIYMTDKDIYLERSMDEISRSRLSVLGCRTIFTLSIESNVYLSRHP